MSICMSNYLCSYFSEATEWRIGRPARVRIAYGAVWARALARREEIMASCANSTDSTLHSGADARVPHPGTDVPGLHVEAARVEANLQARSHAMLAD